MADLETSWAPNCYYSRKSDMAQKHCSRNDTPVKYSGDG